MINEKMTIKDSIIKGLICCTEDGSCKGLECPFFADINCTVTLMRGTLELIKEQERKCRALDAINREIEKAILYGDGMSVESSIWDERDA